MEKIYSVQFTASTERAAMKAIKEKAAKCKMPTTIITEHLGKDKYRYILVKK